MTNYQKELLKNLYKVMMAIANECTNDERFNEHMANLGIFTGSIDEQASKIEWEDED